MPFSNPEEQKILDSFLAAHSTTRIGKVTIDALNSCKHNAIFDELRPDTLARLHHAHFVVKEYPGVSIAAALRAKHNVSDAEYEYFMLSWDKYIKILDLVGQDL